MTYVYTFLVGIMDWCYSLLGNYGWAILLFTLITKIILLPLTLWTYFNSIKMVKIQPDINFIKVKYYGQKDQMAEEQAELFKQNGYNPLVSIIPTLAQLILLIGVIDVIKKGIANPSIDMYWGPVNLGAIPSDEGVGLIWVPIVAGLAAYILCVAQNRSNVMQAEQSKLNKFGVTSLSVGLSLYLGWFVAVGTVFYWVCSNLLAVLQLHICNWIVKPKNFIDYKRLEESRNMLEALEKVGGTKKEGFFSKNRMREREDYKKFFSVVNKHLVFYSEKNGFYKYYKGYIEYILSNTNLTIHYISSDPSDKIFELEKENPKVRAYYIGENRLITLMMKLDTDVMLMTTPDLENYHLKRSYVRKDIEYIYAQHDMNNHNLLMRKGCVDHFDTVFCTGIHQKIEVQQTEAVYGLPRKNLIEVGYPLIDEMRADYGKSAKKESGRKKILIAPSWQNDNIIDICLEEILDKIKIIDADIIVRPHPQEAHIKHEYLNSIKRRYEVGDGNIEIQTDFSSNSTVLEADLLITDWSGICWEYAFVTYRPVLFINTPMKIMNPEWKSIELQPINISLRNQIGKSLDLDHLDKLPDIVNELLAESAKYAETNRMLAEKYIYNLGHSAEVGANYIIETIKKQISNKKELRK